MVVIEANGVIKIRTGQEAEDFLVSLREVLRVYCQGEAYTPTHAWESREKEEVVTYAVTPTHSHVALERMVENGKVMNVMEVCPSSGQVVEIARRPI
jgi:hypothetical protein